MDPDQCHTWHGAKRKLSRPGGVDAYGKFSGCNKADILFILLAFAILASLSMNAFPAISGIPQHEMTPAESILPDTRVHSHPGTGTGDDAPWNTGADPAMDLTRSQHGTAPTRAAPSPTVSITPVPSPQPAGGRILLKGTSTSIPDGVELQVHIENDILNTTILNNAWSLLVHLPVRSGACNITVIAQMSTLPSASVVVEFDEGGSDELIPVWAISLIILAVLSSLLLLVYIMIHRGGKKEEEDDDDGSTELNITECPECGAIVNALKNECPECGMRLSMEVFRCYECGARVGLDEVKCPECGSVLHVEEPERYQHTGSRQVSG